jgi:signal transduction histidine kinase
MIKNRVCNPVSILQKPTYKFMGHLADFHSTEKYNEFNYFQLKIQQLQDLNRLMAHNLRGAASNIKMLVDAHEENNRLGLSDTEGVDLTNKEIIEYIRESSVALIATLDKLMEMNKASILDEIAFEKCDIKAMIDNICRQLSGTINAKNVLLKTNINEGEIIYSKVYLESILYNLISNAIKYSPGDKQLQLDISSTYKDGRQCLQISDNGLGMDLTEVSKYLFKPFRLTKNTNGCHGFGLYMIKSQIESLGGEISVISEPNSGTTFTVLL